MVHELPTPTLVVDRAALDHNIATMAMARHVADRGGHRSFCCATLRELEGMAAAGLGEDLLLANETLDGERLRQIVERGDARITVAVDSEETIEVAAAAGAEVLIDVDVGLPRCGCQRGLTVRGVMGYEGHVVGTPDRSARVAEVRRSMDLLALAHDDVGGLRSAGGTGTYDLHHWADEVQAGSYLLMDTHYARLGLPFRQALFVETTVISISPAAGWGVVDAGLKAFGMDHGDPDVEGHQVFFCSDEHTTFLADPERGLPRVGSRIRMTPAHVDPTVACHERMYLLDGDLVVDEWAVDLRSW